MASIECSKCGVMEVLNRNGDGLPEKTTNITCLQCGEPIQGFPLSANNEGEVPGAVTGEIRNNSNAIS